MVKLLEVLTVSVVLKGSKGVCRLLADCGACDEDLTLDDADANGETNGEAAATFFEGAGASTDATTGAFGFVDAGAIISPVGEYRWNVCFFAHGQQSVRTDDLPFK